ncbi:MAG TPA: DUF2344 domain-containing protein [Eubacteriaceae bacterium]|nr:DUF2344 domain-containing protein [Eubacteriaceae bacterium]
MIIARIKFSKGEEVKYISHLDLQRAFQRALRRAEIDIAYSKGFNPHPKVSFATALSVGMTSDGEYVDVELNNWQNGKELTKKLNGVLAKGIKILDCVVSDERQPSLMSTIKMGLYQISIHTKDKKYTLGINSRIKEFLSQDKIIEERINKRGKKTKRDIKPLIKSIILLNIEDNIISLEMQLATGSQNNVKPEIVIKKLVNNEETPIIYDFLKIHRVELFTEMNGKYISPIDLFSEKPGRENM